MVDKKLTRGATLDEALDKVEARFLHNLPKEELSNIVRVCFSATMSFIQFLQSFALNNFYILMQERLFFQIEQAHWFYEVISTYIHDAASTWASDCDFRIKHISPIFVHIHVRTLLQMTPQIAICPNSRSCSRSLKFCSSAVPSSSLFSTSWTSCSMTSVHTATRYQSVDAS